MLCALVVSATGAAQDQTPQFATRGVQDSVGQEFTMCGRVVSFDCSTSGDTVLLNFDTPDGERRVSIGVRSARRPTFGERFEDPYLGAQVCATGRVERADKGYVLVVDAPASLALQKPGPADAMLVAPSGTPSCGTGIQGPKPVRKAKPTYPADAQRAKIQGIVKLEVVVLADGKVGDVRVVSSLDQEFGLDAAAVTAVRKWLFTAGQWRGRAVPMLVTIGFTFTLN